MDLQTVEGAKRLRVSLTERLNETLQSISTSHDTWRVVMLRQNLKELDRMIAGMEADQPTSH